MGRLLSRFAIGSQVGAIGVAALIGFALIGALYVAISSQRTAAQTELDQASARRSTTNQIIIRVLQLRLDEDNLVLRHDASALASHATTASVVGDLMTDLSGRLVTEQNRTLLTKIRADFTDYLTLFKTTAADVAAIGLTEEDGLRGRLRLTAHDIESKVADVTQPRLMISMLSMRRHEKDFIERQDPKYAEALRLEGVTFDDVLQKSALPTATLSAIHDNVAAYLRDFQGLVSATARQKDDLRKMNANIEENAPRIRALSEAIGARALEAKATADASRAMLTTILGTTAVGIATASGLLAWLIGHGIARPITAMTAAMKALAAGDKTIEIPGAGRGDEVGAMAEAVSVFRSNMIEAERLASQQASAQAVKARRQEAMNQHTQDFGASISGVMASLATAAGDMRQAADAMTQTAGAVHEQAAETATGAARSSRDLTSVAAAVEQMTASIEEIARQVASATKVAHEAVRQSEIGQGSIKLLAESTSRIGSVVSLISDIAGQTNLLALNATIEAARAGDAGKGFAVVAGEVKALATQTTKATAEIGAQIAAIQNATGSAIAVMDEIGSVIAKVEHVSSAIAAAVEEQSVTTREIASSVQAVTTSVETASSAMNQVVGNADKGGQVALSVTAGADEIARQSGLLRAEVDNFLQAVRADDGDNRQFERVSGNGLTAALQVPGQPPETVKIRDISRAGAALESQSPLPAGTEVQLTLAGHSAPLAARSVRVSDGIMAIVFLHDAVTRASVGRFMDTMVARAA